MEKNKGVIYCATGRQCAQEFNMSAESLAKSNPNVEVAVFVDEKNMGLIDSSLASYVNVLESPFYSWDDKIEVMQRTPFEKNIFIDTDTLVFGSLSPVFDSLEYCSIAACHEPRLFQTDWEQSLYSSALPQWNTGLVAFTKSETVDFMEWWKKKREENRVKGAQTQFRQAVYETGIKIQTLRQEYNVRLGDPNRLVGDVVVVHHHSIYRRSSKKRKALQDLVNADSCVRAWLPSCEAIVRKKNDQDLAKEALHAAMKLFKKRLRVFLRLAG